MKSLKDLEEDSWELNAKVLKSIPFLFLAIIFLLLAVAFDNIFLFILTAIMMFLGFGFFLYCSYKWFKLCCDIPN
jgi:Ca2+/Na+ antiporter